MWSKSIEIVALESYFLMESNFVFVRGQPEVSLVSFSTMRFSSIIMEKRLYR